MPHGRLWLFAKNTQTIFPLGVPGRGLSPNEVNLGFYCNSSAVSSLIRGHGGIPGGISKRQLPPAVAGDSIAYELAAVFGAR